jgi:hypothetical protein
MQKLPKQQSRKQISWPDVYFTAEANRERFDDVNVVTLKSYLAEKAYDIAIAELGVEHPDALLARVRVILDSGRIYVSEHVKVNRSGIRVVVDCELIDEDSIWKALDMVASALEQLNGMSGKIHFGSTITYKTTDIGWLNLH